MIGRWVALRVEWLSARRVVGMATVGFVLVYGMLILTKHARFGTQAFDLGIFDQGLWLLSRFETPFVTIRGLHLFADHSSYILVLLAPLYWIWADVRVLLMLTVLALAAGGPLVYLIARTERLPKPLAAALAVGFLLHPAVGWNVWDVFHPEVLAVPLLLGAYLLTARGRPGWGAMMLGLTLLVKEDAALVVVPLALYLAWRFRTWRMGGTVAVLGLAAFAFNVLVALPYFSPNGALIYTSRYAQFGDTLPTAIGGVFTSPGQVLTILTTPDHLLYLAAMILPLGLAVLAPEFLLVGVPITVANLLSSSSYQANIKYHYTAYLLAIVALAAVRGATRLKHARWPQRATRVRAGILVGGVVLAGTLGNYLAGPWPINDATNPWGGTTAQPDEVRAALALIPVEAVVSADWFIAPHLTHRDTIYMYPNPFVRDYWSINTEPPPPTGTVEWAIMRTNTPDPNGTDPTGKTARALQQIRANPDFEEVIANDWILAFRRIPAPQAEP